MKKFSEWLTEKESNISEMGSADAAELDRLGINPVGFNIKKKPRMGNYSELPPFKTKGDMAVYYPEPGRGVYRDYQFVRALHPLYDAIRDLRPELTPKQVWDVIRYARKQDLTFIRDFDKPADKSPEQTREEALVVAKTILASMKNHYERLRGYRT